MKNPLKALNIFFADLAKNKGKDICPNCNIPFNEWFYWPGLGDYCYPCYTATGVIYCRDGKPGDL